MASKNFEISDVVELRVMQRIMREAKFCIAENDTEISTSPIVSQLFKRLMDALIEAEVELDGEEARTRWLRWLNLDDPRRDEWQVAVGRAANDGRWEKFTDQEKRDFSENVLCPFTMAPDLLNEFIYAVESKKILLE
ncbi:MAG: hypothetical protein V4805_09605 [Pseudomonadota bacterium]